MARPLIPWLTAAVVLSMVGLAFVPDAAALEYRAGSVHDQPWRLLTSQLVHWSVPMLVVDVLLVGIAGAVVERRSRALAGLAIATGAAASAVAMVFSDLARYRGSSGIGTALLVAGGFDLVVRGAPRSARLAGGVALAICAIKLAVEGSGRSPFLPPGVVPATAVHVGGALAGAVAWVSAGGSRRRSRR